MEWNADQQLSKILQLKRLTSHPSWDGENKCFKFGKTVSQHTKGTWEWSFNSICTGNDVCMIEHVPKKVIHTIDFTELIF